MADTRTYHVELTVTKWVEVKVSDDDIEEGEYLEDVLQEEALGKFWTSEAWGDDYELVTVKEVMDQSA